MNYKLTRDQKVALLKVYQRDVTVAPSYLSFRRRAWYDNMFSCVMLHWKGMVLGIESDGYTHS